jgi:hypothetical protein
VFVSHHLNQSPKSPKMVVEINRAVIIVDVGRGRTRTADSTRQRTSPLRHLHPQTQRNGQLLTHQSVSTTTLTWWSPLATLLSAL